ncbi:hypothetical protein GCM10010399_67300 [Dactylosporangium fulvum]|uniref:Glycosyltransferase RgtA/B/C/D-like domain-containing protein n=1 Tax=Dactylosporangium fulvum TaxID=53359 RepID=A0ABY5W180_9ACTN|nr:hypothetical protein [Dactylosporangium fulvum]UWP83029.1 hypothetical protein Dfulv_01595 [Dactylosporangium fulvum]
MVGQVAPENIANQDPVTAPTTRRRLWCYDVVAGAVLLASFPAVHDVKSLLTAPYWADEAWVALSVRFPLSDLPITTSSSPLGWSFLLRLVPDDDDLRVVPLVFHLLTVLAAYLLGRVLAWPARGRAVLAGFICAAVVLLLPAQQIRHDLKQYTADAAVSLGLLVLSASTEQSWSRRRLSVLTAAVAVGMMLSHVTAVVAPCVFGGLVLVTAIRRQWRRLVEVISCGIGAGLIIAAVYFGISGRGRNDQMQQYWVANFPTVAELPDYLQHQLDALMPLIGVSGPLVVALIIAGLLTVVRWARPATAVAMLLLLPTAIVLGVGEIYPLLETRTSHFLLVAGAAAAGIGIVGAADLATSLTRRALPAGGRQAGTHLVATAAVSALLVGGFAFTNHRWYRFDQNESFYYTANGVEDVRSATEYVTMYAAPGDVILVSNLAWYGFAFYSRETPLELVAPYGNTVGFYVDLPGRSDVIRVSDRNAEAIRRNLELGIQKAAERGPDSRVWLIRSHIIGSEAKAWQEVLADYQVQLVTDGLEPVALITRK